MNTEIKIKWKELGISGGSVPAVWVGCLGCYNSGLLNGSWVDAINAGDINNSVEVAPGNPMIYGDACQVCVRCGSDEFWVFDTDNMPEAKEMSPHQAQRIAEALEILEEGSIDKEAYQAYASLMCLELTDIEEWKSDAEENYIGEFNSYEELAEYFIDNYLSGFEFPDNIRPYFDYEAYGRDIGYDLMNEGGHYWYNN